MGLLPFQSSKGPIGYPGRTFLIAKSCTNSRVMSHLLIISQSRRIQFAGIQEVRTCAIRSPHTNLATSYTIFSMHYRSNKIQGENLNCCCYMDEWQKLESWVLGFSPKVKVVWVKRHPICKGNLTAHINVVVLKLIIFRLSWHENWLWKPWISLDEVIWYESAKNL